MTKKDIILIVDDDLDISTMLSRVLHQAGFEVMLAQDGASALEQVQRCKPDLILLDIMMPNMDGFETATRLKAQAACRDIPIIFLTALSRTSDILKGFEIGGVDFLIKPVEIAEALARIKTHLAFHKLQRQLETRTQELSSLLKLSQSLTSTLKLEPLASLVLDQLKTVVDYTGGAIVTLAKDELSILAYRGPSPQEVILNLRFSTQGLPLALHLSSWPEPLIIADLQTNRRLLRLFQQVAGEKLAPFLDYTRAWMGVPLVAREQLIGLLSLSHIESNYYTSYHSELVSAFAGQAAIAIDNAHLYQQARQAAAIEERHRLARDLHDSVTQALYGLILYADAARLALSAGKQTVALDHVQTLRHLAQEAMLDMRLLIFELRPPFLEEQGLVALLQARLDTVEARSGFQTDLRVEGERRLPLPLETELYRVAQEVLNNVVKHAQARQVTVQVQYSDACICLVIRDDGVGFEVAKVKQKGGLGLRSIEERAQNINGHLTIESAPGQGTTVTVEVEI